MSADLAEDSSVRAAAIVALAEQGERVPSEPQAPVTVAQAQRRAAELVATQHLIAAHARGERGWQLPEALLLAPPSVPREVAVVVGRSLPSSSTVGR